MILLNLTLICIIIVYLIDFSGIVDTLKNLIRKTLNIPKNVNFRIKPFDCSFCSNFWCSLIYIIVVNHFSIFNVFFILTLSTLTPQIKDLIMLFQDLITKLINKIYEYIDD